MSGGTLVLGFGNPARRDDGLGPACAERIRRAAIPGVRVEVDYQLRVEDAVRAAAHRKVVFVDAAASGPAPFSLRRVPAGGGPEFTTHSVSPAAVLALARDCFAAEPEGWILAIRGYEFEGFAERLSPAAEENLRAATDFLTDALGKGRLAEPGGEPGPRRSCTASARVADA